MPASRQKVVLYNPQAVFYTMPLALQAVASHLDPDIYDPVIIDGRLENDGTQAVLDSLDGALCFGVSVLSGAPIRDALRVSRAVKAARPDIPVVWGGWHPSMFGTDCLAEPAIDITVQAQGEVTFAEIVDRLRRGESLEGCAGCCYRGPRGEPRANPPRPMADVNDLSSHRYDLINVPGLYDLKGKRQLDYVSSQGCHFRCAFCSDPFVYNRQWTGLDPERVGEELEYLWRQYRFDDVNFQDETFFTYPKRVEGIAEQLIRRNLNTTWAATLRADQCARLPEEVFALCKRSGLRRVLVGVESGSQEMLDRIEKDIKIEQVFLTAERCRKHGVAGQFPFIVGFPDETDESVRATFTAIKRLRKMSPDFQTPIFYFRPYPGSSLTQEAVRKGFRLPSDLEGWSKFDYVGPVGGPWVSPRKFQLVERFKFFSKIAWDRGTGWQRLFQPGAKWRCEADFYRFPVEQLLAGRLAPDPQLS